MVNLEALEIVSTGGGPPLASPFFLWSAFWPTTCWTRPSRRIFQKDFTGQYS